MVLFPIPGRKVGGEERESVAHGLKHVEGRIGRGKHEALHAVLKDLKGRYR
jgi:hypothetical protein